MTVELIELDWRGQRVRIENEWIAPQRSGRPVLVFLHEGLGSRSMWRDFPQRLCDAGGYRGLVYSRPGYGRSTPRKPDERWGVDFMHRQALRAAAGAAPGAAHRAILSGCWVTATVARSRCCMQRASPTRWPGWW